MWARAERYETVVGRSSAFIAASSPENVSAGAVGPNRESALGIGLTRTSGFRRERSRVPDLENPLDTSL